MRRVGPFRLILIGLALSLISGCSTDNIEKSGELKTELSNSSFVSDYNDYLQNTLASKSFTENISVYYDFTDTDLPNYQLHTDVEIKAVKDKAVSSVTRQYHEDENTESNLVITRINDGEKTYSNYHEEIDDVSDTSSQDRKVKFTESLNEAYDAALPYSSLYDIKSATFDTVEFIPASVGLTEKSGTYTLVYNSDYFANLIKEDVKTFLANTINNGEVSIVSANAKVIVENNKLQSITIFSDGVYSEGDRSYNFLISMSRSYSDLDKTHALSISSAEEPLYKEVDQTQSAAE